MQRPRPHVSDRTRAYWESGADGRLRLARCQACGHYQHPPAPVCPSCRGRELAFEPVSGRGTVWSYTVNRYQWKEGMPPPYVIAEVELAEQPGLKILTNIVDCEPEAVTLGMAVTVRFDEVDGAYVPVFRP